MTNSFGHLNNSIGLIDYIYDKELIFLSKNIKKDTDNIFGINLPKLLKSNEKIIGIKDNENNLFSFIWFGFYENETIGKFVHINCSYTFKKYRLNGLNLILRKQLEKISLENKIYKITSKPLDGSGSDKILFKLGYIYSDNYFIKYLIK